MGNRTQKIDAGRIDFLGKAIPFGILSGCLVLGALACIAFKGFVYGIDFSGGTEVQVQFTSPIETEQLRRFTESIDINNAEIQSFGESNEFLLRFESQKGKTHKETNAKLTAMLKKVTDGLKTTFASNGVVIRRVDSVGPQIGRELKRNGLLAAFYSLLLILIYVGLRFDYQFAPGAVISLFHDAIITLGIFSLLEKQVNVQTMAAILTIIGYSLNDTIVNFDRVRENVAIYRNMTLFQVVNRSINDVLGRTILTSFTTLLAVASLYFIAGGVIEDFAFTLGIGVIVGTYSSIYVANPLLLVFDRMTHLQKS